jgi:hypothetical protein
VPNGWHTILEVMEEWMTLKCLDNGIHDIYMYMSCSDSCTTYIHVHDMYTVPHTHHNM